MVDDVIKLQDVQAHADQLISKHLTDQQQQKLTGLTAQIAEVEAKLSALKAEYTETQSSKTKH
jgi:hypothetical protein